MSIAAQKVDELLGGNAVVVFTRLRCAYSAKAIDLLLQVTSDTRHYAVDTMADGDELHAEVIRRTGHELLPAIFVRGQFAGGFSDVDAWHKQGKLPGLLA